MYKRGSEFGRLAVPVDFHVRVLATGFKVYQCTEKVRTLVQKDEGCLLGNIIVLLF